jgi:hypothetical protein
MPYAELESDLVHELLLRKHVAFGGGALNCNLLGIVSFPYEDLAKCTFSDGFFVAVCDFLQLILREDVNTHTLEYVAAVSIEKPPVLSPLEFENCKSCYDGDNNYYCSQSYRQNM